jgi:dTDP-4-dehydrorhamnose 3,5-epimerase
LKVESTSLPGVLIVTPSVYRDARGFFLETYSWAALADHGVTARFVQDNHSRSVRGTLRGLHYQLPPAGQDKLVRVSRGAVWDVAVDIRRGSPTFGRWVAEELSEENFKQLLIPAGFAHGFCVLSEIADVLYKASHPYSRVHEGGIAWNEPALAIPWPVADPLLSDRDRQAQSLSAYLAGQPFAYEAGQ